MIQRQVKTLLETLNPELDMVSETNGTTTCSFSTHV